MGDEFSLNNPDEIGSLINIDNIKKFLGYTNTHPIESILISRF